jgi:hypothetical protein
LGMTEGDLKEVLKEVKLVRKKLERLEGLVEERLVGCESPLADEVEAVAEYEAAKKKKALDLVPLKDATKGT